VVSTHCIVRQHRASLRWSRRETVWLRDTA
jgi:hypothetical protein